MVEKVDSRARYAIQVLLVRALAARSQFEDANEIANAARVDSLNADPSRTIASSVLADHPFEAVRLLRPTSLGNLLGTLSQWLSERDDPALETWLVNAIGVAAWTHPEWHAVHELL